MWFLGGSRTILIADIQKSWNYRQFTIVHAIGLAIETQMIGPTVTTCKTSGFVCGELRQYNLVTKPVV